MLKPMFDFVLVRRDDVQEKTSGGLIIADTAKEKPSTGTVVATGTPEEIVKVKESYTGQYLKKKLEEYK